MQDSIETDTEDRLDALPALTRSKDSIPPPELGVGGQSPENKLHPTPGVSEIVPLAPEDPAALRRRVLGLAWPVIGENLLETLLGIVDTVLVAGLGAAAVAGVGSGLQIMFFLLSALSALSIGSSILVAQAVGAEDLAGASRLARQSLVWSALFSIPLALVGLFYSHRIIGIFRMAPEVAHIGTATLQVTMGTVVVLGLIVLASGNTVAVQLGGAPSGSASGGFFNTLGAAGQVCIRTSAFVGVGGIGASSPFGGGGNGSGSQSNGGAASGFGAGGGGAASFSTTGQSGGAGSPGLVIVEEFY